MINRLLIVLLGCIAHQALFAQNEGTLFFMNSISQSVYTNPAFFPKYKTSIGLPGSSTMVHYGNNGFSYKDFATKEAGVVTANLDKLYSSLKPKNYLTQANQVDILRLSFKTGARLYLTWNVTAKTYSRLMLPKDFLGLFLNGSTPFLGKNVSISPKAEALAFVESGIGGAYQVNKNLNVGLRVKWLKGIGNATTKSSALNIAIDPTTYAMTAQGNLDLRTSGVQNFSNSAFDFGDSYADYLKNNGFAIDLGATYRIMDRINLSFSVIDLGSIKWKNNTYGYSLDPEKAKYTFKGIDLNAAFNERDAFNGALDSLQNRFEPTEGTIAAYRTAIPTKFYLGGNYEIRRNFTTGMVLHAELYRGRLQTGLTAAISKNFGKVFSATGSYTLSNFSYNNIGVGASLNLPPFQLYLVGDNILRAAFAGKELNKFVNNTQVFNLRAGLNIILGWDKMPDKLPSDAPSPAYKSKKRKSNQK